MDCDPSKQASHGVWLVARLKKSATQPDPDDSDDAESEISYADYDGGSEHCPSSSGDIE